MTDTNEPPIRIFLSYAQADDVVLDFIEPFTQSLKHMAFTDQGRTLEIFVDRETIGWGEDWREGIRQGIESAAIFMPIVTRQYFERPWCRDELLAFYSAADRLRATGLVLPVVLLGHSYISTESTDIASRIIAERQYKDLKETWTEGPQSAIWRRTMVSLAAQLVEAVTSAEQALSTAPAGSPAPGERTGDDAPGVAEVSEALELFQQELDQAMPDMKDTIERFSAILSSSTQPVTEASPPEARRLLLEIAAELQPLGIDFQNRARKFETTVLETDQVMRSYVTYLKENDMQEQLEKERQAIGPVEEVTAPLADAETILSTFLLQMKPLEAMSAPLRNSIRGFRDGTKAVSSALRMMRGWGTIVD
ncbi:toll/interleukin-1 receptor domain-containing protein [Amycolatopsis sp. NPDC004079]|uniref:toll/interleukin-1 receptor domain-containing protein n=1 Tax=Amycolatopsis sp. NPDC004079 TaxID=3154549 RepID=UPI0033A1071F